jgi:histone-lysine N-methyltransferase SETD2
VEQTSEMETQDGAMSKLMDEPSAFQNGEEIAPKPEATGKEPPQKKGSGGNKQKEADDDSSDDEADMDELEGIFCCDGPCLRSFHPSCCGFDAPPGDAESKWYCDECSSHWHKCFICGEKGEDDEEDGVHKCQKDNCGRYFHHECVMNVVETKGYGTLRPYAGTLPTVPGAPFTCPSHSCSVCTERRRGVKIFKCIHCVNSFHFQCFPPGSRIDRDLLMCDAHRGVPMPWSEEDGKALTKEEAAHAVKSAWGKIASAKKNKKLVAKMPSAKNKASNQHFRLDTSVLNSVESQPPPFKALRTNDWALVEQKSYRLRDEYELCQCPDGCEQGCLNSQLQFECFGKNAASSSKHSGASNCSSGPECGNRRLQKRQWAKVKLLKPSKTGGKGWGLIANADLRRGDLIIEYMGEVINDEINTQRLEHHRRTRPNDTSMYSMDLGHGLFLDARHKGSLARFINHSCDPNCELQKWDVRGLTRIAVVARQDIAKGVELHYDYQFSTNEAAYFKCHCGTDKCRGTLAGGDQAPGRKKKPEKPPREPKRNEIWDDNDTEIMRIVTRCGGEFELMSMCYAEVPAAPVSEAAPVEVPAPAEEAAMGTNVPSSTGTIDAKRLRTAEPAAPTSEHDDDGAKTVKRSRPSPSPKKNASKCTVPFAPK